MKCYGLTDKGIKRKANQDFFRIYASKRYIASVVCDGMGGAKGGLTASRTAAITFMKTLRGYLSRMNPERTTTGDLERVMINAVTEANTAVYEKAGTSDTLEGMGTTLVAFLYAGGKTIVINTGDSRLYASKGDKTKQVTKDHSFVQYLVDTGIIAPTQAEPHPQKNIIINVKAENEHAECDVFTLSDYDSLLLCTDGLVNMISFEEISSVMESELDVESKVETLITLANDRGGFDNITAVIFQRKDENVSNG